MNWISKKISIQSKMFLCVILFVCVISYGVHLRDEIINNDRICVTMLNIGQGDAFLIQSGNGNTILIDTGPDESIITELGRVMKNHRTIDIVLLTHPDADHIGGFEYIIETYAVKHVVRTNIQCKTKLCDTTRKKIAQHNIPLMNAQAGQILIIDTLSNIHLDIVYPFEEQSNNTVADKNEASIVSRLVYKESEVLFTGDAPKAVERSLLRSNLHLASDVLKVGHHGSESSTSSEFLQEIKAKNALISAGKDNKYGHPHKAILDRLHQESEMKIFRTDESERVQLCTKGNGEWLSYTYRND